MPARLSERSLLALTAPAVPMWALIAPLAIFIPSYYAERMGLGLATVGALFAGARLFDVVTDPFAGALMDRLQDRLSRRAWITIGAAPLALAIWQIFFPGDSVTAASLMAWLLVLYVGWTLMSVGLFAWAGEVTSDYDERSRVMGRVQVGSSIGTVAALLLPALVESFAPEADVLEGRINALGAGALVAIPLSLVFVWLWGPPSLKRAAAPQRAPLLRGYIDALRNASVRRLLLADLATGINLGAGTSLAVFFIEIVLGHAGRAGTLQLLTLTIGMAAVPLWVAAAQRLEKHRAFAVTALFTAAGGLFALWVPPHEFALYVAGGCLLGVANGGAQFLPRAVMADVVDADRVRSGEERAGLYFALLTTTLKLGLALGIAFAFVLAEWAGFDPATAREASEAHFAIRWLTGGSSAVLGVLIFVAMWRFPFGREAQREAERALAERG